jgi:AraC-like DNA-binding protein
MTKTLRLKDPSHAQVEVRTMEWIAAERQPHLDEPHKHDYYVMMWLREGQGTHEVDFQSFELSPNSFWFLSPGQTHALHPSGHHEGFVVSFTNEFFCLSDADRELFINTGLFSNFLHFRPFLANAQQVALLLPLMQQMQQEFDHTEALRLDMLRSYLKIFLIQAARLFAPQMQGAKEGSRSVCLARQFMDLVDNQFRIKGKVSDYADRLHVSPNHLNDTVKRVTGQPASEHIKHRVILEAKRKAYFGNNSAKEIAYDLGFDDEAHFSKYFKNNTGQTFTDYRKTIHGLGGR